MENPERLFLAITATGRQQGLSRVTRALHGKEVSKPFAMITSTGSLLQQSVASFHAAVSLQRMFALVSSSDEARARAQLGAWPWVNVLSLPPSCTSPIGLLLVLAEVLADCPQAEIIVVSANCYVAHPEPFVQALLSARHELDLVPAVLLGATSTRADASQQWLIPGRRLGEEIYSLSDAKLQPSAGEVECLLEQGALMNTSALIARGRFLWQTLAREMPSQARAAAKLWRAGRPLAHAMERTLAEISAERTEVDLDTMLLRSSGSIAIAKVEGSGWSNWRTPDEVFQSLPNRLERGWLMARLEMAQTSHAPATSRVPAAASGAARLPMSPL